MIAKLLKVLLILAVVMLLSPLILGLLWFGGASWSNPHPTVGENVAHVD